MPATAATKAATSSPQLRRDRGPCEPAQHLGRLSRRTRISNPQGGTAGLLAEFGARRATLISGTVTDWARESWETSRTFAYGSVMADPCGPKPATRPVIDERRRAR
jgi:hypothetical protein